MKTSLFMTERYRDDRRDGRRSSDRRRDDRRRKSLDREREERRRSPAQDRRKQRDSRQIDKYAFLCKFPFSVEVKLVFLFRICLYPDKLFVL